MKIRVVALAAMLLSSLLVSAPSYAQGGEVAAAGLQSLVGKLELNDEQKAEVNALIAKYTENTSGIRDKVMTLQKEMKDVDLGKLENKEIQRLAAATGRYSAQFTEATLRLQSGFYAILDADQRKKFDDLRNKVGNQGTQTLP